MTSPQCLTWYGHAIIAGGRFAPSSIDSQSESDEDEYLAAAAAAADARVAKPKKVKHPHLKALRSKLGSISRNKDKDGSGSTHTASPNSQQVSCPAFEGTWCSLSHICIAFCCAGQPDLYSVQAV